MPGLGGDRCLICSFQGSIYRKIHFLYSLVPGSADDSGTSQTELWQMGFADLMLFTATQQRAWLDRDVAATVLSVPWRASPTLRSGV